MKIHLLYPNLHGMNMLPPAIGLFSSILKAQGHQVELFDSTNWIIPDEDNFDSDKAKEWNLNARPYDDSKLNKNIKTSDVFSDFRSKVESFAPGLIAVSVTEDMYPLGIRLLKSVKDLNIPVIMGGVFATFAPDICLSNEEVDMVCLGEGESPLSELCERMEHKLSYLDVKNLWIKTQGGIVKNPIRPPEDFSSNPLLDIDIFEESRLYRPMQGKVWKMLPVETHRGCPYQCAYCNSPTQQIFYMLECKSPFFRKKSFEAIRKELLFYKEIVKAEAFYFWADTFMAYTGREFAQFQEIYQDIRLPFWCQSRPEEIREERIRKLMDIGCFRIGLGVEHGNEDFRRRILRRKNTNATIIENMKILNKCGITFSVNNIVGFPTETRELAMDTIELNRQIDSDSVNAYSFSPFHGTPLRKMAEEMGFCDTNLIARSIMRPTVLNMPQFPPEAIEAIRRCFVLYVKMPRSKWPAIEKAEALTPEGDAILSELRAECQERYITYNR